LADKAGEASFSDRDSVTDVEAKREAMMGLFEQACRETEGLPLTGALVEVQQVLDRVRSPADSTAGRKASQRSLGFLRP